MDDVIALAYQELALAVLVMAYRETHNRNGHKAAREAGISDGIALAGDAKSFLLGDGARWLVAALDISPATWERIVAAMPEAVFEQLQLFGE